MSDPVIYLTPGLIFHALYNQINKSAKIVLTCKYFLKDIYGSRLALKVGM